MKHPSSSGFGRQSPGIEQLIRYHAGHRTKIHRTRFEAKEGHGSFTTFGGFNRGVQLIGWFADKHNQIPVIVQFTEDVAARKQQASLLKDSDFQTSNEALWGWLAVACCQFGEALSVGADQIGELGSSCKKILRLKKSGWPRNRSGSVKARIPLQQ